MNGCSTAYALDTVVVTADPLCFPLETGIISLSGKKEGPYNQLRWTTTANQSASYFQVERSKDNQEFVSIGKVMKQGDEQTSSYTFNDENLETLDYYYRIRTVGLNGNTYMSKIIMVSSGKNESLRLAVTPNPVQHKAHLVFSSEHEANVQVIIYNNSGKIVHTFKNHINRGASMITVDGIQQWPKGIYIVRALIGERVYTQKMILTN